MVWTSGGSSASSLAARSPHAGPISENNRACARVTSRVPATTCIATEQ